ncbi:uncharacterized protein LOC134210143 [Armigeres subalbatus]|uniref:uncharacterized protein LOC134210143 n=1 Tax=Armigeres subalbatus TaxID=124917 RepID=UPI002ED0E027
MKEFVDEYFTLRRQLQACIPSPNQLNEAAPAATVTQQLSHVKLPELKLPLFKGNLRDWLTFRDSFKNLIANNSQLSAIDKFTYLRSCLSGEALQEIESIEMTAVNYTIACQALESREFDEHLQMLDKLGEETAKWSTILAYMLASKLDTTTLRLWETEHRSRDVPTYNAMLKFLKNHCIVLQSVGVKGFQSDQKKTTKPAGSYTGIQLQAQSVCPFCGGNQHSPFMCGKFKTLKVEERRNAVMMNRLCFNCLGRGHVSKSCSRSSCRVCGERHHSMLHLSTAQSFSRQSVPQPVKRFQRPPQNPQIQTQNASTSGTQPLSQEFHPSQRSNIANNSNLTSTQNTQHETPPTTQPQSTSYNASLSDNISDRPALLATAIVIVEDSFGSTMLARALLDSGSQFSFMSENLSQKLKFRRARSLSHARINRERLQLPEDIVLADPTFCVPNVVDIIVGAGLFYEVLSTEKLKPQQDGPLLLNTELGWIVCGKLPDEASIARPMVANFCTEQVDQLLKRFWELETCRSNSVLSVEESTCEAIYDRTTIRDATGRFVVTLPKKEFLIQRLGDSRATALKRFLG